MNSPSARFRMFRQHSQRYSRTNLAKGLKVKHVLQIAVVVVVLTWVMYELNLSIKPASQTGSAVFDDAEQEAFLGRKALKPEGGPGKFGWGEEKGTMPKDVQKELATDRDDSVTKSSQEENFDASRTEEDSDDQGDRDISELDIERAADQDEKSEDETMPNDVQHDVGTDFEELKNEQARVEQEENGKAGKDDDVDEDSASQAQDNEATTSVDAITEGGSDDANHQAGVVDKEKVARETTIATFMGAFNADSILKPKLDKLDEGQTDNTSRVNLDENLNSAIDPLKKTSEDSGEEVAEEKTADQIGEVKSADQNEEEVAEEKSADQDEEEKSADQNEEEKSANEDEVIGEKDAEDETLVTSQDSTVLNRTGNNPNNQSEVEGTQRNLDMQSEGQPDENKEKTEDSVETNDEGKVVDEKLATHSHVQEQEEKKQEEAVEEKDGDTQIQQEAVVKKTESTTQSELKSEGADVEVEKKADESEAIEGEKNKLVQPEEEADGQTGLDAEKDRLLAEKSIQDFRGTLAKDEAETEQDHDSGETKNVSESQQDDTEQKKDEYVETKSAKLQETQVETDSQSAEDSSDSSDSKLEKNSQEDHSAETVNTDASTQEDPKQEDDSSKDETLKQVTDSNAAGNETKIEDQSDKKTKEADQEVQRG
ncbi:hypothetical protein KC19_9G105700 [Ceratodon purpureus]|uniref:Uncharacterized protein n=1 Tax=Ceratodon purpureus TaxID=3225 RepID=A0A8T0GYH4_CERPU|nr:hypothetical protein KC19_9G105700 [Ceratodon purpureus]